MSKPITSTEPTVNPAPMVATTDRINGECLLAWRKFHLAFGFERGEPCAYLRIDGTSISIALHRDVFVAALRDGWLTEPDPKP